MNILLQESADILKEYFGERLDKMVVERAVFGLFFSGGKVSTGHGGLCFTPVKEIPEAVCCPSSAKAMPLSGKLSGRSVKSYLDDLSHANILRKTLAIATLNALSACYWEENKNLEYKIEIDVDSFDVMEVPNGKKRVVIGALVPMLKKLLAADADFKVLEMDSRTLKGKELEHFAPSKDANMYLSDSDLDVITGVTILNDTLPDLLAMCKPGADILVTGPTAGMIPDAFFKRGVTVMGGILVTKTDELLNVISEGGSGYHFFGKSAERIVIYNKPRR